MEEINVKELCSVLSSTIQSDNGMTWSEDHKVSLITASAIHVFEVVPNPNVTSGEICLKKSIIKPSDDAPTADAGVDTTALLFRLEQRDAYSLILDMKLAPYFPDARSPDPHFTSVQWSPASMYQDHRCIIATLTCTGCLKLYVPYVSYWVEVTDLSQFWVKYCKSQWIDDIDESSSGSEIFEILKKRTSQMKITAMVWGKIIKLDQERYTYMATITHNGILAIWRVNHLLDLGIPVQNYHPEILTTCETNMYNARALHWMQWNEQISVVVGDSNGCVTVVTFSFDNCNDTISVQHMQEVWKEKDHIQVSCIKSLSHSLLCDTKERILGVTKNSFLLIFLITQEEVTYYCHDHLGGIPLTGLEVYSDDSFIVCTLSGVLCKYHVRVKQIEEDKKLVTSKKILKSNLSWQDVACFGISKNFNNDLWTLCTNLCKMYDHLVMRRPSQVSFCTISEADIATDSENEISTKVGSSKLRFNWESLEIFRVNYLKELKAQPPKEHEFRHAIESMSTTELQMELWRARIVVAHLITTDMVVRNPEACAYVTLLEELILCRHACKYICSLLERHEMEPLNDAQLHAMGLLRLWLQTWLSHNKPVNSDKNSEPKTSVNIVPHVSNVSVKTTNDCIVKTEIEMDTSDDAQMSTPCSLSGSVVDVSENVGDNDAGSVGSFDDAISSDSNSSSVVSENTIISKRLQVQQGRVPANFLKTKLVATRELVTNTLALPVVPGTLEKELCPFCEQEVQMDLDWRSGTCPASHRLSRCCHCLSQCHHMPYRLCMVCPTVACLDIDCDVEPFCTFCDSPLIVDEKFRKPGFTPLAEKPLEEESQEKVKEKSKEKAEKKSGETAKEMLKEKSGETAKEMLEEKSGETAKEILEEKSGETAKEILEEKSGETAKEMLEEKAGETAKEMLEEKAGETAKEMLEEKSQEKSKENVEEKSEEMAKKTSEGKTRKKSEEKAKKKSEGKVKKKSEGNKKKSEGKIEKKSEGKAEKKSEGKAEKKSEGKGEKKSEGKAEKKSEGKGEKKSEGKGEKKSEGKAEKKSEGKTEKKLEGKAEKKSEGKVEKKSEGKAEKKSEGKVEKKSDRKKKPEEKTEKKSEKKVRKKVEEKAEKKIEEKTEKIDEAMKNKTEKETEDETEKQTLEKMESEEIIGVSTENISAVPDVPMDIDS